MYSYFMTGLCAFILGFFACAVFVDNVKVPAQQLHLQKRAIEMNYGEYNNKTGNFEWIDKNVQKLVEGEKK